MTEELVKYLQECRAAGITTSVDPQHGNTINDLCRIGKISGPITVGGRWPQRYDTELGRFVY